jgi:hypothetical protein
VYGDGNAHGAGGLQFGAVHVFWQGTRTELAAPAQPERDQALVPGTPTSSARRRAARARAHYRAPEGRDPPCEFTMTVDVIEPMGMETMVFFTVNGLHD